MTDRDDYYNRAKQQGYRARSAYKLRQIDETVGVFESGDTVVDLGAAPGGWSQIAAEAVGPQGRVIAVDRARIEPFDPHQIVRVRGDITDERTRDRIRAQLGDGPDDREPTRERATLGASADVVGDDGESAGASDTSGSTAPAAEVERPANAVISDMAPDMSGEYELDHARSIGLAETALDTAEALLAPGGTFVVKVFDGRELDAFKDRIDESFAYVRAFTPDASRESSSERYLIGVGRMDAPVAVGEKREVKITDTGDEGDGIATVDGYTLFVPDTTPGETVAVRVTDVRARFGFAERLE